MLHHDCALSDLPSVDNVAGLHSNKVAAAQLAINREVKQRTITQAAVFVEEKADLPYFLRFERALRASSPPRVPYWTLIG